MNPTVPLRGVTSCLPTSSKFIVSYSSRRCKAHYKFPEVRRSMARAAGGDWKRKGREYPRWLQWVPRSPATPPPRPAAAPSTTTASYPPVPNHQSPPPPPNVDPGNPRGFRLTGKSLNPRGLSPEIRKSRRRSRRTEAEGFQKKKKGKRDTR